MLLFSVKTNDNVMVFHHVRLDPLPERNPQMSLAYCNELQLECRPY